jgi:integrase/recombinase XerD
MKGKDKSLTLLKNKELANKFQAAAQKKHTINDFVNDFIHQFVSEETQKAYLHDLKVFFDFLKSGDVVITHPNQIQGYHFQYYRDALMEEGYASATINRKLVAIRSFIKWAMSLKLLDYNPLDVVKLPKVQTDQATVAFDDDEVVKMLDAPDRTKAKGCMNRMAMVLLFSLGLRRSELVNIKIEDFYNERGHSVLKIKGKGDKERHMPLNQFVLDELEFYINDMQNFDFTFEKDDYLLQSQKTKKAKKKLNGSTVYRMIEKYANELGIDKRVSPHSARATAISHLLDTHKTPIRDVASFAGHANITTTERYDKRRKGLEKSAAYKVNYKKSS